MDVFALDRVFALSLALFLVVPVSVAAQDGDGAWLSEFRFDQLKFVFWPGGVENRQDSDGTGSALTVHAEKVAITDWDALDVRHCIDGDDTWCSYPEIAQNAGGNKNGEVEQAEVESFQRFAQLFIRLKIDSVDQLADTLRTNITVDGKESTIAGSDGKPRDGVKITKLVLNDVLGTVDSDETIYADVEAKATYDNDKDAKSHLIHIGELILADDGFIYEQALWTMGPAGWKFDAGATKPEDAKRFVSENGYFSSQDQFESLSDGGVDLSAVKSGGAKKSPDIAPFLLFAALVGVAALVRRRT